MVIRVVVRASRGSLSDPVQRAAVLSLIGTALGSAAQNDENSQ